MITSLGQVCEVAKESHTFWDCDWGRELPGVFIPTLFTDGGAARKQQVSPVRVNLELRDYKLMTGMETRQVLERFWWEKTS